MSKSYSRAPRKSQKGKSSVGLLRPPQFDSTVKFTHKFRFLSNSAATSTITRARLLNLLVSATAANTANRIFSGARLIKVEVWAVQGASSANPFNTATVSLEWISNLSPTTEVSDSGNAENTAHISCKPPSMSTGAFWSMTGSNETESLFILTVPVGSIVDVTVELVCMDGETPVVVTIGSGTAGFLSAVALDDVAATLIPVSYTNVS